MTIHCWRLLLALLLCCAGTAGAATIDVTAIGRLDLAGHVDVLEDPSGTLDLDGAQAATGFDPGTGKRTSMGFSRSAWWVRLTLRNPGDAPVELVLRQDYPLIDELDVWNVTGGRVESHVATGDRRPFDTRAIAHRDFLFPIVVPARSDVEVYARMRTQGAVNIGLSLYRPAPLLAELSLEQLAFGVYFGGFFVLVVYNFFIFLAVRDRPFLYYILYAASYGLYFGIHDGLSFQFLWPGHPAWANTSLGVTLALALAFGIKFTRAFLDMAALAPRLDRLAQALQWLSAAGLPLSLFAPYNTAVLYLACITVLATAAIIAMGMVGLLRRQVSARYFMIAWTVLLAGVMVYMFKTFGLLPHNGFTQNGFQIGALIEMVLLSLALAHRVRELSHQSRTDTLTQLMNRRAFDEELARELRRSIRRDRPLSLLLVDVDHFKAVNDSQGHAQGDRMLKRVAMLLAERVGDPGRVCRHGGEEFAILLPGSDAIEASLEAERVRQHVRDAMAGGPCPLTVSIGVATTGPSGLDAPATLLAAADAALYRAKARGRDRVEAHA